MYLICIREPVPHHEAWYQKYKDQGLVIFIDARSPEHYQGGHIPGAYAFDYYHYDDYLATVVPACQNAQQVVIYCAGGKCDDSRLAANFLGGIMPREKLMVYGGGITEWVEKGWPVEKGARGGQAK